MCISAFIKNRLSLENKDVNCKAEEKNIKTNSFYIFSGVHVLKSNFYKKKQELKNLKLENN